MRYQEILEACWKGYQQQGMKKKGNRQVPNCVPVTEVEVGPEITANQLLYKAAAMAMRDAGREGISLDYDQAIKQASKIYGIPYQPSELPKLLAQRQEIDRQLALLKQGKQVAKARRQEKRAPTPAGSEEYWKTHALPTDRIKPPAKILEAIEEDLKKWFKEKWVRFGPDGKIRGDCARGSSKEGKPKCLPQSKAHALGKKGRASAAAKKRREDPNPERRGAAKNVATRVKEQHDWDDADEFGMPGSEFFPEKQPRGHYKVYYMTATDHKLMGRYATQNEAEQRVRELKADYPDNKFVIFASQRGMKEQRELDEKQDACYSKVKSRYKVWPSAYASGALVQCRKKGAANWGTGGKKK